MNIKNGFTLIELTVVMVIIGLIVAGAAQAFSLWLTQHRLNVTNERIAMIDVALTNYVQENGDLPCAAPRVDRGVPGYGRESDCTDAAPTGTAQATGRGGRRVRIGAVPVRTLDLSDEHMRDGWYNDFTYAVTEVLASDNPLFNNTLGAISVVDETGTSVITPDGSALYAVISHGYQRDCVSGMDAENCDDDDVFSAAQFSTANNSGFFDDFIAFATDIEDSTMSNIENCGDKGMLFAPDDPAADADGCIFPPSLADASCPNGEAVVGFSNGNLQCAAFGGQGSGGGKPCDSLFGHGSCRGGQRCINGSWFSDPLCNHR